MSPVFLWKNIRYLLWKCQASLAHAQWSRPLTQLHKVVRPSFLCGARGGTELSTAPHSSLPCWCGPSRGYESFAHRRPCCCLLCSDIPRSLVSGGSSTPTASLGFCLLHSQLRGNLYIWPFTCKGSRSSDWANCGRKCSENNRVCWHVLVFLLSQYAVYIVLGITENVMIQNRWEAMCCLSTNFTILHEEVEHPKRLMVSGALESIPSGVLMMCYYSISYLF